MKALGLLILALCLNCFAQEGMVVDQKTGKISYSAIGTVTLIKGKVYRTKISEQTSEELGINFPILEKDIIQTAEKSAIKIQMNDSTIITLGQNSHFNFKNYTAKSKTEREAAYDLKMGKARVEVPVKLSKGKLNFNTRTVSLGVRGTEFLMQQEIDKKGNSKEQIALLEGEVEIEREDGKIQSMTAGDHYLLKKHSNDNKILDRMIKLEPKFLQYLKAEGVSKKSVKPFLTELNESLLNENSNGVQNEDPSGKNENGFKKVKNFWKKSLEELNKKLKGDNE